MYLNIGIDIAKNVHEVCFVDDSGEQIGKFMQLKNSRESLEKFRNKIDSISKQLNANQESELKQQEYTGIHYILSCPGIMIYKSIIHPK
jgi:transposase